MMYLPLIFFFFFFCRLGDQAGLYWPVGLFCGDAHTPHYLNFFFRLGDQVGACTDQYSVMMYLPLIILFFADWVIKLGPVLTSRSILWWWCTHPSLFFVVVFVVCFLHTDWVIKLGPVLTSNLWGDVPTPHYFFLFFFVAHRLGDPAGACTDQ